MFPQTRLLAEALREENDPPTMIMPERAERAASDDPRIMQLVLKRKYHNSILKRMLQDAGYGDLAKMTSFKRERLEDYDDGNG